MLKFCVDEKEQPTYKHNHLLHHSMLRLVRSSTASDFAFLQICQCVLLPYKDRETGKITEQLRTIVYNVSPKTYYQFSSIPLRFITYSVKQEFLDPTTHNVFDIMMLMSAEEMGYMLTWVHDGLTREVATRLVTTVIDGFLLMCMEAVSGDAVVCLQQIKARHPTVQHVAANAVLDIVTEMASQQMKRQHMARVIQRAWRRIVSDPYHAVGRRRLLFEWQVLTRWNA